MMGIRDMEKAHKAGQITARELLGMIERWVIARRARQGSRPHPLEEPGRVVEPYARARLAGREGAGR